jgi:hypothetical protein
MTLLIAERQNASLLKTLYKPKGESQATTLTAHKNQKHNLTEQEID